MDENLIMDIRGLKKTYPGFELRDVSFQLKRGEIMGFIGQNGAGKTTTIKLILNLIRKEAGEVTIFGMDHVRDEKPVKSRIGFVFEEHGFYNELSVKANKAIFSRFYTDWDEGLFNNYIDNFNINTKKKVKELSKGMKIKFSLAFALSHKPDLLIMDEPTSGLDPVFRDEFLEILSDVIRDKSRSIFFSSHITSDLEKAADVITYIHDGRIILSEAKSEVLNRYQMVRGAETLLNDKILPELIGLKKGEFGFSAMTENTELAEKLRKKDAVVERAVLDDIMVYTTRQFKTEES